LKQVFLKLVKSAIGFELVTCVIGRNTGGAIHATKKTATSPRRKEADEKKICVRLKLHFQKATEWKKLVA
jgi:hypothetical protein